MSRTNQNVQTFDLQDGPLGVKTKRIRHHTRVVGRIVHGNPVHCQVGEELICLNLNTAAYWQIIFLPFKLQRLIALVHITNQYK